MTPSYLQQPLPAEYDRFFAGYVRLVPETDVMSVLRSQPEIIMKTVRAIDAQKVDFRYAPGKWSVREVFGHIVDSERVFSYRAMCIARGETANLPGFDENLYMLKSGFGKVPLSEIASEFESLRVSNVLMLEHLDDGSWLHAGTANSKAVTVRGLTFIMAGHVRHHIRVLAERYSVS